MIPTLVIPTFERPVAVVHAVKSGLDALPAAGRLLVVDDGLIHPAASSLREIVDPRLEIIATTGAVGPSAARNQGVAHADTDLIFFLDDDDAIEPDYIERIMKALEGPAATCSFGFSTAKKDGKVSRQQMATGLMNGETPLQQRLGGLGMGFWIKAAEFLAVGGLDQSIRVNEDTEFCLRLAKNGLMGWYEATPGVVLNPDHGELAVKDQPSITSLADIRVRGEVFTMFLTRYRALLEQEPDLRRRFALRSARYATLADGVAAGWARDKEVSPSSGGLGRAFRVLGWWLESLGKRRS